MLDQALSLIRAAEDSFLGGTVADNRLIVIYRRLILFPLKFTWAGVRSLISVILAGLLVAAFCSLLLAGLLGLLGFSEPMILSGGLLAGLTVGAVLVMFPAPSMIDAPADDGMIVAVLARAGELEVATQQEVSMLREVVQLIQSRHMARLKALKWVVGIGWASLAYMYVKGFELTLNGSDVAASLAQDVVILMVMTFVGYALVWGYEGALERLFGSVQLALSKLHASAGSAES